MFGIFLCLTTSTSACHSTPAPCSPGGLVAPGCNIPNLAYIKVSPTNATIDVGMTVQLVDTITNNPTDTTFAVAWSSLDTTKATVNSTGLVLGKAVSAGVAICATILDHGYDEANCATVIVQPIPPPPSGAMSSSNRVRFRQQGELRH